ncbi:hypothetical protein STL3553_c46090 [Salmonella enterica subsp. enterica serovar Typhimurium str. L-3553]|uniref:Uncharacterized protein n=5 Tax=Salmonella enterica I TaxID=59201 RepID=E8X9R8_SALT4|nr:hypothetical protein SPAB_05260 [Salmonella enterica subsp. enterica serovar Paratyphi B str. SPB7]ACF62955.1 hypothetical protein SNSL254_A4613 [Salmonella enterica subsp. enterica serovar Newport str. SL254]ACY91471.1 hypothetical protein STM14_5132 [Salmonella enterica subsp. enterica serovar Typhimurium str. 14028S]ADX20038.1 hypothetical protein STM474_4463 [Salmonella enterica subsp. enterica serovar Typhimurium str. ST4/74]AGS27559.1 hypothetical protein SN31241_5850 [Salmonella enter
MCYIYDNRGAAKKQTFSSTYTKRVAKKSKRLSSDHQRFFN